jgi:hypothetical protein
VSHFRAVESGDARIIVRLQPVQLRHRDPTESGHHLDALVQPTDAQAMKVTSTGPVGDQGEGRTRWEVVDPRERAHGLAARSKNHLVPASSSKADTQEAVRRDDTRRDGILEEKI